MYLTYLCLKKLFMFIKQTSFQFVYKNICVLLIKLNKHSGHTHTFFGAFDLM